MHSGIALKPLTLTLTLSTALLCSVALAPVPAVAGGLASLARTLAPASQATALASAPTAAPVLVRSLGGITEYRLANGLQVLLFPDEAQTTTTVNITYRVGSRHEGPGEFGMAHLLEHMLFKGTPTHRDLPAEFAAHAARFNGSTTVDRTNYFASFNANPDTLQWAIAMEADRMRNSLVAKADLDKEMTVVRNEFERGENDPFRVLNERTQSAAYQWHAYGHSTMGPRSDIENVPIEHLQAFYKTYYRPDNATLLIAGKFDAAHTLAWVTRDFAKVQRPTAPMPQPYTVEPAQDGEREVEVKRVGGAPIVMAKYHVPAAAHPDTAALLVLRLMLSMQPSGSLYKQMVETREAVAATVQQDLNFDPSVLTAVAVLPPDGNVAKAKQDLFSLVEGRSGAPFTEAELQRVRDVAVLSYREAMKSPEGLIQSMSQLLGAGDWRLLFQLLEDVPKVTLADVERVRAAYLRPANRTVGTYLPAPAVERVSVPAAPPLAERLADLKPPPVVEAGEQFDPTPAALAQRTTTLTLPSGISLQTLNKRTRGHTVVAQLHLRFGEPKATTLRRGTDLVGEMLTEGSGQWTKQALQDALIKLKAEVSVRSGNQDATVTVVAEQTTLIDTLKIVADLLQHPTLPAAAFERIKGAELAGLAQSRHELPTLMNEATRGVFNQARGVVKDDPAYEPSLDERVDELQRTTLEDVQSFYRQYWSANMLSVSVVGALPEGVDKAVEQLLGGWKKADAPAFVRYVPRTVKLPAQRLDVQAADKTSAEFSMVQTLAMSERDPDYLPLVVAVRILGAGGMESRLSTRIRRELGLSYGVGANLDVDFWGDDASLRISGSFAPQNRDAVLAAVQTELTRMGEQGVTAAEVERAQHELLEGLQRQRANEGALARLLDQQVQTQRDWAAEARKDAALAALSAEQVNAAWRRHLQPGHFLTTTAGDFSGKPGTAASH